MNAQSVRGVCSKLTAVFGPIERKRLCGDPLDELVWTILSQSTTDVNSASAFRSLRRRFSDWQQVLDARLPSIAAAIRHGGLAQVKSKTIKNALSVIEERNGVLDLECLRRMGDDEALEYLTSIPGVGVKTACCVLLFSLRRPVFPVDTHVFRVTRRLGWLGAKVPIAKASAVLKKHIADEFALPLHLYLVWHGRRTCRSQRPRCAECAINRNCRAYRMGLMPPVTRT